MRQRNNIQKQQTNTDTHINENEGNLIVMTKEQLLEVNRRVVNEALERDPYIGRHSDKNDVFNIVVFSEDGTIVVKDDNAILFCENIETGVFTNGNGATINGSLRGYLYDTVGLFDDAAAYEIADKIRELGGFIHPSMINGGVIGMDKLNIQ